MIRVCQASRTVSGLTTGTRLESRELNSIEVERFRFPRIYVLVIFICVSNRTISGAQIFKM